LGIRIKNHKSACGTWTFYKIAGSTTCLEGSHIIQWVDVKLLGCSHYRIEMKVKEAICINLACKSLTMNRDTGMELSPLILKTARGQRLVNNS